MTRRDCSLVQNSMLLSGYNSKRDWAPTLHNNRKPVVLIKGNPKFYSQITGSSSFMSVNIFRRAILTFWQKVQISTNFLSPLPLKNGV